MAWNADYRYVDGQFEHWKFTGTIRKRRQQEEPQRYLESAYRVLLARARQGMVTYLPRSDVEDATRLPAYFDKASDCLIGCGSEVCK
ncbi:DNA/RNA helicase domain-containing protein [Undibacterium sp. FT79W]|uniref:DNA/RNA helicase domain-containing protein n=1 Tax=Undibacterium sp. FT79W TaxID=2762296 RepID=UPI001C9B5BD6